MQERDGRWCLVDILGKRGRIRTVPVPPWVKVAVNRWSAAAQINTGRILRSMNKSDHIVGDTLSGKAVFDIAVHYGREIGVVLQAHDLRRTCAKLCRKHGGALEQNQLLLGHSSVQTTERYLGTEQDLGKSPNDRWSLKGQDNG